MNNKSHLEIGSKIVYEGKFVNIRIDTIKKDNRLLEKEIIEVKKGVVIALISDDKKILLINQYRHKLGQILELPAGAIKDGETPLNAAKRELSEETGMTGRHWKLISTHQNGVHQQGKNYFLDRKSVV